MEGTLSPADVAILSGKNGNGNGFFGDSSGWWGIIALLIILGAFNGNRGFGFGGGNGIMDNYVLSSDFATLERQMEAGINGLERKGDIIQEQLCDGFYNLNTAFGSLNAELCSQFGNVNNNIITNGYETRNAINELGFNMQNCCCQTQRAIDGVNYNMAMNTNSIQQTLCNNTRDIIENNNANYRAIHDEIIANRIEDKNAQIQAQQNEINALRLAASQERQNAYLIDQLKPCPIPAYLTCNPFTGQSYGNGNTCGCNCGNY